MKNFILLLALMAFCKTGLFSANYEIDLLIEELLSIMEVPGVAVGIVVDDEVILNKGYGIRNLEAKLPVTNKTLFQVGSISKGFTSFLIGQLVEEGLVHWDDPISNHIPHFKLKDPYTTYHITL